MADFSKRRFRIGPAEQRSILEVHARNFLGGFNLAAAKWRNVHEVLGEVAETERGFAYEGAGMYAAIRDLAMLHSGRSLARLLSGPGDRYVHLIHTGAGWIWSATRLPLPVPLPDAPLLRWLALDGAGFGETYFGGLRVLRRRVRQPETPVGPVRLAGCGRALWFVLCADPDAIGAEIGLAPEPARGWLFSGAGLAAGYAGAVSDAGLDRLADSAGPHWAHFAQGVVFAAAARARAGMVPAHTELACRRVLDAGSDRAVGWAEIAADGLTGDRTVGAYLEWKERIRELVVRRN